MNICTDCRHCQPDGSAFSICNRPGLERRVSPVTGEPLRTYCMPERSGDCGTIGRYFEPRTVTDIETGARVIILAKLQRALLDETEVTA